MLTSDTLNGINAYMAHNARVGDDNTFVRGLVESYDFLGFGTVVSYANERIKVACGKRVYTNVEVVVIGVDGWGIKPVPAPNDRVLLFSTQIPVADLKLFKANGSMPAYDVSGLKAIPITDSNTKQLLTVNKNGIVLTGNNKITINDAGIQIEDKNKNKIKTSANGVEAEDYAHNKFKSGNTGIEVEDAGHNKFKSGGQGITLQDQFGNKLEMTEHSTKLTDVNGSTVTMDNQAVEIKGYQASGGQHNTVTMSSSGIFITDINHNTITCGSGGIVLNSNLKVIK